MIDLDEEQSRIEDMLARRERMALGVTCTEMIELITRLRQAEKDAARYRWLRDEAADADQTSPLVFMADECADIVTDGDYQGIMFGKLLDAAIDEAMQCK